MKTVLKGQKGFTLVELVVVIAILGVLAAITVPMVNNFLGSSKAQAYNLEKERIQDAVNQYRLSATSARFLGMRQYPIHGALKTQGAFIQPDENDTADTVLAFGNVVGGTQGGNPEWVDNQNGIRDDPDEEVLNDEDDNTQPGWQVATLTRQGADYLVDSRDYFINFEILVAEEYLESVPSSASPDNVPPGSNRTLIGPYSWFVNEKGIVNSLLFSFPTTENVGFQDVFPSQKQPEAIEASTITGAAAVNEGTEYTLNMQSSETRPTPTSWEINWGDGEIEELDGNPSSASHSYLDGDDVVTINAKTTDEEGVLNANVLTLTVSNVAPSIALSGPATVSAGLPYTLSFGQVTDPGQDTISAYNVRWGDGETDSFSTASPATHVYDDLGVMSIVIDLVDEDGTHAFAGSHSVTVLDVPPTVTLTGADSVDEGEVYSLTLDAGNESFVELVVHWGDGSTNSYTTDGAKNHIFNNGGIDAIITVDLVTASVTNVGVGSKTVTVNDVPSSVSFSGPSSVLEGSDYTLTLGPVTGPSAGTVTQVIVNWGDGHSDSFDVPTPDTAIHAYANGPATRTISVDLVDDSGTNNVASLQVTVEDVAPTVGLSGSESVPEGSHYTINVGPVVDPGADVVTQLTVDWGDGTQNIFPPSPGDITHTFDDGPTSPAIRNITVDVLDDDGLHEDAGIFPLRVDNVPPTLDLAGSPSVDEGSDYILTLGAVVDPGVDTVTGYLIDWGDGSTPQNISVGALPANRQVIHEYENGPATPTIRVDVFDEDGQPHVGSGSLSLTVNNVAPTISLSGASSVVEGSDYTLTLGSVVDPGDLDSVSSYIVHWSDTVTETIQAANLPGNGQVTHTYIDGPETHTISVDLVDQDGTHAVENTLEITVDNIAPTVVLTGDPTVTEGATYTLNLGTVDDDGDDTIQRFIVNWGDGNSNTFLTSSLSQATHVYATGPANPTITVDLADEDGTHRAGSLSTLTVEDVAPVIGLSGASAVNEGATYTLTLGQVFDPGADTVFRFVVNWGDNSSDSFLRASLPSNPAERQVTHIYADGLSNPDITVDLEDAEGLHTDRGGNLGLQVNNVPPTIALSGAATVNEGSPYTLTLGAVTDPGTDTVTQFVVNWGDNSSNTYQSASLPSNPNERQVTHTYADGESFPTISVDLVDDDGTHVGAGSLALTVNNVAPVISLLGNPISVNEGSVYTLTLGAVTDPGSPEGVLTFAVHWGDGSDTSTGTYSNGLQITHTYADGISNPTIIVDLSDEDVSAAEGGYPSAGTHSLAVNNIVPSIALGGVATANEGSPYTLNLGTVTDPGTDTVSQYIVHWGDGETDAYTADGDVQHIYPFSFVDQNTATNITVDLVDEDGLHTERGSKVITVINVTPPFLGNFRLDDDNRKPGGLGLDQSSGQAVLWVVDERDDEVYKYSPATGALLSTIELTGSNRDSKGITLDATGFWVLDEEDKEVYRYDLNGNRLSSFDLSNSRSGLEGITTDGSSLFIVDRQDGVFKHDFAGNLLQSFDLHDQNSHAEGIATDGTTLWVVDKDADRVFNYSAVDMDGDLLGSFSVKPATHPEGITTDGVNIWIVDKDSKRIYRFDVNALPADEPRVEGGLVVLYDFEESGGNTVNDVSGAGSPLNLTIQDSNKVSRPAGALSVNSSTIVQSAGPATKVINALRATNEITIEAWVNPANTTQDGPARIVTLSSNPSLRNFTLGQENRSYDTRLRTTSTNNNGIPSLRTPNGTLTTQLTHVVYTRSHSSGTTRTYINGVLVASGNAPSSFSNWDQSFRLGLANEFTLNRTWLGEFHLVAIYDRDLTPGEVIQNFNAGP